MRHLLGSNLLRIEHPSRTVLDNVTIGINDGDRIGVVGKNGSGKSTLLKSLSGTITPHSGSVISRKGLRVGYLDQDDYLNANSTVEHTVVGKQPNHQWAGNSRIRDVISGLLAEVPWQTEIGQLSGGQIRRVSLAALLVQSWDVLFLDEPTNHLDINGIAWLSRHLESRWPAGIGALVVVTHDRWFLDASTKSTWEVRNGRVQAYEGGYAAYVLQKLERQKTAAVAESKRQNLLKKELAWLRRGAPARTAKPKFRTAAANALIEHVPEIRDSDQLAKVATKRLGKKVIDLVELTASQGDKVLLKSVTWRLAPGERAGVLGQNGVGKSTLLSLLSGEHGPDEGSVSWGSTVKLGVIDQQVTNLDNFSNNRISEVISDQNSMQISDGSEMPAKQVIEGLGFKPEDLATRVRDLSGGQKKRLAFVLELLKQPNVLLLDEPTNDLDTEMLTALESMLDSWVGSLIVVSHDRFFLERTTDQQYAIQEGELRHLPGGVEQYLGLEDSKSREINTEFAKSSGATRHTPTIELAKLTPGSKEHRDAEKEANRLEKKVLACAEQIRKLDAQLVETDHANFEDLKTIGRERLKFQERLDTYEAEWLELLERLD